MRFHIHSVGAFRELTICDFERDEVCVHSGLLDATAAQDLAEELQHVARQLAHETSRDAGQFLLPFARAA